jgi:hypothetical protein
MVVTRVSALSDDKAEIATTTLKDFKASKCRRNEKYHS